MYLLRHEVQARTGLNYSEAGTLMSKKRFPLPIKDDKDQVVWWESEVQEWMRRKLRKVKPNVS